jgi:hypothetical protein
MLRTTWTGHFQNRAALERQYQQIYTYLVAAEAFWNPHRASVVPAEEPAARFRREWERSVRFGPPIPGALLDLRAAATRSHVDQDGGGWVGKGREFDLRALPAGKQRFGPYLFEILDPVRNRGRSIIMLRGAREELRGLPERVRVAAGQLAAVVAILHATPFAAPRFGEEIGAYVVRYVDGTQETIPLLYKRNIGSWLDEPVSIDQEIAWAGKTLSGLEVRLSLLRWVNPHPGKTIAGIEFTTRGTDATPAIFAVTLLRGRP